jgi:integrase
VSEGVIESNSATGVKKPASEPRTARLSPTDYRALGIALDAAAGDGVKLTAIAAVRLLPLTGCRKGEVLGLRWSEVDDSGRAFRLVDSKKGASVPLSGQSAVRHSPCWPSWSVGRLPNGCCPVNTATCHMAG